jgi:hypothetical protein
MTSRNAEGLTAAQLIADLLLVVRGDRRSAVLEAQKTLQGTGTIPVSVAASLRRLYVSNLAKIHEAHTARERARVSMALEKSGDTRSALNAESERKAKEVVLKKGDLGF